MGQRNYGVIRGSPAETTVQNGAGWANYGVKWDKQKAGKRNAPDYTVKRKKDCPNMPLKEKKDAPDYTVKRTEAHHFAPLKEMGNPRLHR